ncbi:HMHA1 protein, partial [Odontophorus gujanensis]|nr:HMHA1 protein [Odontophorus gujanensis]
GFHYESNNEADKREFEKAVETIAVSFSSTVSEFLMGEVDSSTILSIPPSDQNQSMESLYGGIPGPGGDGVPSGMESYNTGERAAIRAGIMGSRRWQTAASKPSRRRYGHAGAPQLQAVQEPAAPDDAEAQGSAFLIPQTSMPFLSIYLLALEQDMEYGTSVLQAVNTLQHQTFLQPLSVRRLEHEKRRKEIKEQWHRAQRKLQDAEVNLRKAKQVYMQRSEEHEKAKYVAVRAEEEQQSTASSITTKTLDKKRRLEEEAKNKVGARQLSLLLGGGNHSSPAPIPAASERPGAAGRAPAGRGCSVMEQRDSSSALLGGCCCESFSSVSLPTSSWTWLFFSVPTTRSPFTRTRKGSFNASDFSTSGSSDGAGLPRDGSSTEGPREAQGGTLVERRAGRGHQVHKSWPTSTSKADSNLDSSSGEFSHKLQRLSSNGTTSSSEELGEKDENAASFEQSINGITPEMAAPTGPFRNVGLSRAAQTHRLRKLRTPSKCRECNSYVYFQGAECEECYLACHKKCLETLAIQCGHKKLQGKLQLFGQDFLKASQGSTDGIPFIIKKCISEIEKRALKTKGIYRVNGVKTRVEKLCQAFENGKELVELSQASPHDISNVLKLYLRQLPEPLVPFRMYNALMGAAKESLQGSSEAKGRSGKGGPELEDRGADTDRVVVNLVLKLKELLKELPWENTATLQYLLQHLRRIVEVEQDNKMTSSNLGIVFGPTLLRPRPTDATISLSSLVDYPHQARVIEALIIFYPTIFE